MNNQTFTKTLDDIQNRVELKEGVSGLLRVLATVSRFQDKSIKKISQESEIPVPICVAIRNEFEKVNWVHKTSKGAKLTSEGNEALDTLGGLNEDFQCENCFGMGVVFPFKRFEDSLAIITKYCEMRGVPNTQIDQSYATTETNLARVFFLSHKFDLFRKNYAFIGDSDLTSIALALFAHESSRIVVFDIDTRIGEIINLVNEECNLKIQFVEHDLRNPIPIEYHDNFECILTDPPYTRNGCNLFISRGIELLSKQSNGVIYLSFTNKPPKEMKGIESDLLKMGCLITDINRRFNKYVGAQKLGGVSTLYRLEAIPPFHPTIEGLYENYIYTGDIVKKIRNYLCIHCSKEIEVGKGKTFVTIEQLKKNSCPFCHHNKFRKMSERSIE